MKKVFAVWLYLVFLFLIGFWVWFPSGADIRGCLTTSMFDVELCPGSKDYVPLKNISRHIQNAVIITEDSSFYQHKGFDEEGIQHCFEKLKQTRRIVCGGSTITQQLAKNMFLSRNKSFIRKGLEALITIQIERTLTKKEILERYLNVVQFGKNIYGVKQASQFYFKKPPSLVTPNEAAFLAMVLPNPEKYSQSFFRKDLTRFARRRVNQIVRNLHRFGRLDAGTFEQAANNIDYFIKGQEAPPPAENLEELSAEDLDEMISEMNEDEAPPENSTDKEKPVEAEQLTDSLDEGTEAPPATDTIQEEQ